MRAGDDPAGDLGLLIEVIAGADPVVAVRDIILAGLWAAPISGASMNPVRSFGPALIGGRWHDWWAYLVGPMAGAGIAVGFARILRGPPSRAADEAAQGSLPDTNEQT